MKTKTTHGSISAVILKMTMLCTCVPPPHTHIPQGLVKDELPADQTEKLEAFIKQGVCVCVFVCLCVCVVCKFLKVVFAYKKEIMISHTQRH